MATVPRLDMTGTVGGALPSVRQSSVASPELFGAAANKDIAFGEAITKASDPIARIVLEEAEKNAVARVQEARTELGNRTQSFFEEMRKNNVGAAAAGVTQSFRDWYKKQAEEIGKNLTGDVQRAFVQQAGQHGLAARGEAANFEHNETVKYRTDTYNRTNDGLVVEAARASTDLAYIDARNSLVANVQARAMTEKWDEKQLEDNMRDALTKMHEARAKTLATDLNGAANPKAALEYIKSVDPKEINPLVRAQLTAGLKSQNDQQAALDRVTDLMTKFMPESKEDPIPFEKIDAALRAEFKDNPEALRAARAEAHFRTTNYNADIQQVEAKSLSALYDMYNNKLSPEAIRKSEEYVNAGPKAKMQFNKMMDDDLLRREQIAATRASRASAEESRAYTKVMRDAHILERTNLADTLTWLNPDKVRGLPEERIKMLQGQIGLENMVKVHNLWRQVNASGEKMKDAQLDNDTFTALAYNAGILPRDGKASNAQKADAAVLKDSIEYEMNRVQQITKKPLTRDERDAAIARVVDAKVIEARSFWFDKTIRPQTMQDKDILDRLGNAQQDEKKTPERRYIEELLREEKTPISDKAVTRLWRTQMIVRPQAFLKEANIRYTREGAAAQAEQDAAAQRSQAERRATGG